MKRKKPILPKEHLFSHQYCIWLHDVLLGLLVQGEKLDIFNTKIPLKSKREASKLKNMNQVEMLEWFKKTGRGDYVNFLYYQMVIYGLLSDMCHFLFEALRCSEKGKLTVSFALLRKPLKDNLFYLEWLLAEPKDFLKWFENGDYDVKDSAKIQPEKKIEIIKKALEKAEHGSMFPGQFIYGIRYDRSEEIGFEGLFQKANHLVTTRYPSYRTANLNFNFIYSGNDARLSQWNHLYRVLPILLFHAVQIVEALIDSIKKIDRKTDVVGMRTIFGMMLWAQQGSSGSKDKIGRIIKKFVDSLKFPCPNCKSTKLWGNRNLMRFYKSGEVHCSNCKSVVKLQTYVA